MTADAEILPERVEGDEGVVLRRWVVDDAAALAQAVAEAAEHLRPWMSWMAEGPPTAEAYRALLDRWQREWLDGGDVVFGVFVGGRVAGGCGLHRRRGPGVLEIGYWVHPAFTRRGLATAIARLLTDAAFSVPGIEAVEIHHDKANSASSGVPRRLGFRYLGETPDGAEAPAEAGVDCTWRMERAEWEPRLPFPAQAPGYRESVSADEPASYLTLESGTDVESSDGERVGAVEHVLSDEDSDIFDGIIIDIRTGPGGLRFVDAPQVAAIREDAVVLAVPAAEVDALPNPEANPAVMESHGVEDSESPLQHKLRRAWEIVSGRG